MAKNDTIILTGWGWKEYAVAAAAALKALNGNAVVMGMSKRRLPEFLESEGENWKKIVLVGLSLGGDEARLEAALKHLKGKTIVAWISGLPMSDSQTKRIAPLLRVRQYGGGPFNGSLVRAVGEALDADVSAFLPFVDDIPSPSASAKGKSSSSVGRLTRPRVPAAVAAYHELLDAAMFAYRNYQDNLSYSTAIEYLAGGVPESGWSAEMRAIVEHYRRYGNRELVGKSAAMTELRAYIDQVALHPEARVLILGESGTGKETVALQIHTKSPRNREPFYAFNCASVNPELLESRFFGHEKGAFTGADRQELGLFELADGGTLFLDEIGELPLEAQGLLLRVLEGGRFMRVGGRTEIKTDVRLVTATNRDLPSRVRAGKFREDLFMRLNVVQLRVPPLREHKDDIRDIADGWWFNRFRKHLAEPQIAALRAYDYPGNVRELLNLLERAAVLNESDFTRLVSRHVEMNAGLLGDSQPSEGSDADELELAIRRHVKRIFYKYAQNLSHTAAALKISRTTLRRYL